MDWLSETAQWVLIKLAVTTLLVLIFNLFIKKLLQKLHSVFLRRKEYWNAAFVDALYTPLSCYVWLAAALTTVSLLDNYINEPPFLACAPGLLPLSTALFAVWFSLRWKNRLIKTVKEHKRREHWIYEPGKLGAVDKLITLIIFFLGSLLVLESTGRPLSTLLALGGIGAAAIGFASKEFIANFFGSFMVYITKPFVVGDFIRIPSHDIEGIVMDIGWYLTRVIDLNKQPIFVPNSIFSQAVLITPSRRSHRLIKEVVGVRYSDMEVVQPIVEQLKLFCRHHPKIDQNERLMVHLTDFAASSIDITVLFYTISTDLKEFNDIKEELLYKAYSVITANGAQMAYPTTTLDIPHPIQVNTETR